MRNCYHPGSARTSITSPFKGFHCSRCDRDVKARPKKVFHGTAAGYDKHHRVRKGSWKWPACQKCREAHTIYVRENHQLPESRKRARERTLARSRAWVRLQKLHPGEYAKLYTEELELIRDGGDIAVRAMEQEIAEVLAAQAARLVHAGGQRIRVENAEKDLVKAVNAGYASLAERERWSRVVTLRNRIAEIRQRAPVPDSGS